MLLTLPRNHRGRREGLASGRSASRISRYVSSASSMICVIVGFGRNLSCNASTRFRMFSFNRNVNCFAAIEGKSATAGFLSQYTLAFERTCRIVCVHATTCQYIPLFVAKSDGGTFEVAALLPNVDGVGPMRMRTGRNRVKRAKSNATARRDAHLAGYSTACCLRLMTSELLSQAKRGAVPPPSISFRRGSTDGEVPVTQIDPARCVRSQRNENCAHGDEGNARRGHESHRRRGNRVRRFNSCPRQYLSAPLTSDAPLAGWPIPIDHGI